MQPRRAVVGREAGQRARRAQARAGAPARERAVQIDGQAEVAAEPVREQQRLGGRGAPLGIGAVDDGRDVEHAHARVQPLVRGQVDPLDRLARALQQRLVQPAGLPGEREHAAVVVRVAVDVEQARAAADEGGADGVERLAVAALGDVGDGEEQASPPGRSRRSATASPGRRRARASSAR